MERSIHPSAVQGHVTPPCSKSYAQRALAVSLLADGESVIGNLELCNDTRSAMRCVTALGGTIREINESTYAVRGGLAPKSDRLLVGESGLSTRLFTPLASLCSVPITIEGEGTMLYRPISMMVEPLRELGVEVLDGGGYLPIRVTGPIRGGEVHLDGSVSSQFLTGLLLSLPVMLEAPLILKWWLGIVPAHTVAFVRLTLVISIIDSLANPLIQAASATGRIRRYQSVVGTLLILILPFSYVALKLGAPPEGVFVVQLVVFCVAQAARVWMLRPLISFSVREYLRKAGLPIAAVTCASLVLPLAVYVPLEPSFLRFVAVCAVSAVSVCGAVYAIGLAGGERKFVVDRVKAVAAKFRKTR